MSADANALRAEVRVDSTAEFEVQVPVVVIGGGACGQIAALAAHDAGAGVLILERDRIAQGSTALSSGFIPACETRWQEALGIKDSVATMTADILAKAKGKTDADYARLLCATSSKVLHWLADSHDLPFVVVEGFSYPGHSALRMHAHPERTGGALMTALSLATARAGIGTLNDATADTLIVDESLNVRGVEIQRPDGRREAIGCGALVLATNGYGGNPRLVDAYIPAMSQALYFGHPGNQGHAVLWGERLDAGVADLTAFQGHGSVASPHGVLITWAIIMSGGVQVNELGQRFSDESLGYSEQARHVIAQSNGLAWDIYGSAQHALASDFQDYRDAEAAGAIRSADSVEQLAMDIGVPPEQLRASVDSVNRLIERASADSDGASAGDEWGRRFRGATKLTSPYYAVRVTGALFHTQGGLVVGDDARVQRSDGEPIPNLFAGGGAARGVSGNSDYGYLSGNGLLAAVSLGWIAGNSAASLALG